MENKSSANFSLKIKALNSNGFFAGYASVFDKEDFHNDIIIHGAFRESLNKANFLNIKLLWQHNPNEPIGYFSKILEDEKGLYVEGHIDLSLSKGKEAYSLVKSGAIDGLSVGFKVEDYELDEETNTRIILKADLWEISLVTFPANNEAKIKIVKCIDSQNEEKEIVNKINNLIYKIK